jgi:hypothetical protein
LEFYEPRDRSQQSSLWSFYVNETVAAAAAASNSSSTVNLLAEPVIRAIEHVPTFDEPAAATPSTDATTVRPLFAAHSTRRTVSPVSNLSTDANRSSSPDGLVSLYNGFRVEWNRNSRQLNVNFRLNVLSTDFTKTKGVRGMALKLCVYVWNIGERRMEQFACKVRVFRDKGAERRRRDELYRLAKRFGDHVRLAFDSKYLKILSY